MTDIDRKPTASSNGVLRKITRACVRYAERYIPDPYLYALLLTFITVAAALIWTTASPVQIVTAWYDGVWAILAFAMQMALILSTGVALAAAPPVKKLLHRLASLPTRQSGAAVTVFLTGAFASWLNWGFGLVAGALVAREVAKRIRDVDLPPRIDKREIRWPKYFTEVKPNSAAGD